MAPQSAVRAPRRPLRPAAAPPGAVAGSRGDPGGTEGRVGVSGGVSRGEAAEPRLSSDFSSATFRAPLTSAIPAFPSLLAPGLLTVPFPPGTRFLGPRGGLRARSPRPAGLPPARSPSRPEDSRQLRPAALPLQAGADAAPPGSSGSRGGGGEALRAGSLPILPGAHYHRGRSP